MSLWELFLAVFALMSCFAVEVVIIMALYFAIQERVNGRSSPNE